MTAGELSIEDINTARGTVALDNLSVGATSNSWSWILQDDNHGVGTDHQWQPFGFQVYGNKHTDQLNQLKAALKADLLTTEQAADILAQILSREAVDIPLSDAPGLGGDRRKA